MKPQSILAASLATFITCAVTHAAALTWDGVGGSTWDTGTTTNWTGSAWAAGDDAVFGANGVGIVTIATGGVSASNLTFNTVGYTISGDTLTLAGADTITTNADATISSVISGSLVKAGSGTLTLSGNSVLGTVTINAGVLDIPGEIFDANAWQNYHTVEVNYGATIRLYSWGFESGNGLNGMGVYGMTVNGGTIEMAASQNYWWQGTNFFIGAIGATLTVDSGITWGVGANNYTAGTATEVLTNNSTLTFDGAGTGYMYMAIQGTGSLTKNGSGTWVLYPMYAANSYAGATTINAGTLQAGAANALNPNSAVTLANTAGAALNLNGYNNTIPSLTGGGANGGNVTGAGTLTTGGDNTSTTFAGAIIGASLDKVGTGTLTLSGTGNAGNTTITGGVLDVTGYLYDLNNWQGAQVVTVGTGGTLRMHGWNYGADSLGVLSAGAGNVVVDGGTIEVTASNGWWENRGFTIGAGGATLLSDSGVTFNIGNAYISSVTDNSSLTLGGAGSGAIYLPVVGTGTLTKNGGGTWSLLGANNYSGNTTVNAGTLSIAAPNLSSTATLSIASGAVLNLPYSGTNTVGALIIHGVSMPNGPYDSTNTSGAITGTGVIQVGAAVVTPAYLAWAATFPGFTDTYPTHDPLHCGMTNQQKYAFGLDPTSNASINPIAVPLNKSVGTFSYTRLDPINASTGATGLTYAIQTSSDLNTWTVDSGATQSVTSQYYDVQTVQVTLSGTKPLSATKLFVRVVSQ